MTRSSGRGGVRGNELDFFVSGAPGRSVVDGGTEYRGEIAGKNHLWRGGESGREMSGQGDI